jgi:hypothetical protein
MKKVEIQIQETLRYEDEIIIIQPEEMTDERFEEILDNAEKRNRQHEGGAKDLVSILSSMGLKIESESFNFPESPRDSELEIINVRNVK